MCGYSDNAAENSNDDNEHEPDRFRDIQQIRQDQGDQSGQGMC